MREAINHLRDLGHQRVAYIGGSSGLTISDHRISAFHEAMSDAGLTVDPDYILAGNYRITGGESCMEELLNLSDPPTAIMSANDLTAIGALRTLRRRRFSVPEDFSVIGFDDIDLSDIIYPPLTTLRLSRYDLALAFYEALSLFGKDPHVLGKQLSVSTSLIIRSSTAAPSSRG
jgi:LacI family transcriptional regulator